MENIFLWAGIVFLAVVLYFIAREDLILLTQRRVRTRGTVFDHLRRSDGDGDTFSIKVRFHDESGRQVEIVDTYGVGTPKPPVGTVVDLVYPARAPEKARVKRLWVRWVIYAFILAGLAILFGRLTGWLNR